MLDFVSKFINASWSVEEGFQEQDINLYYSGQMELLRLCQEYISAWNEEHK